MDKRTNNDLQNTTQKTKDRATRTPLKTELRIVESTCMTASFHKERRFWLIKLV